MTPTTLSVSAAALLSATAASAQDVPQQAWDMLAAVQIEEIVTETSYTVNKTFPEQMKNGVEQFDITGFAVPMPDEDGNVTELYVVSDMGFCPFCGSPKHGTTLQVSLSSPMPAMEEGTRITLRGQLNPVTDTETFQSAHLVNASVIES